MGLTKLITATALATAFTLGVMPSSVGAQTLTQEQELRTDTNVSVVCTGAYGQSCTASASANAYGKQYQRAELAEGQRIVYRHDGTPIVVHEVANTALDFNALAGVAGTLVTGSVAGYLKLKNRVA